MAAPAAILIIQADERLRTLLEGMVTMMGYQAAVAASGARAQTLLHQVPYDLVILSTQLPDMTGIDLLNDIKAGYPHTEVLILTVDTTITGMLQALQYHVIDYLIAPLSLDVVYTTIERGLQRRNAIGDRPARRPLHVADLPTHGPATYTLTHQQQEVVLTSVEFRLFVRLAQQANTVCSYAMLANAFEPADGSAAQHRRWLRLHLRRLRSKLKRLNITVVTIRGTGYLLVYA